MASWFDLSRDSMLAARRLLHSSHVRSSVSRAYYAAYCAVAAWMVEEEAAFPRGWNNPAHEQLVPWLSLQSKWSINQRRQLCNALRRVRMSRESADYRPGVSLTRSDAVRSLRDAGLVMGLMEVTDEDQDYA